MKKTLAVVAALLLATGGILAWWKLRPATRVVIDPPRADLRPGDPFPHDLWTAFLSASARDGRVRYAAVKADPSALNAYLGYVARYSPESHPDLFPTREDRLAYALNAYNACVVKGVIDHYPVDSVRAIGTVPFDFFTKIEYPFGGRPSSLEDWETSIRKTWDEPRIHFALNCASLGCPRLPSEAFLPATLEAQLARETAAFLGDERNVSVSGGKLRLSSIFKWYRADFEGWMESRGKPKGLAAWIRAAGRDVPDLPVEFADYDWGLNDLK
ncbi:MAG: DUF547 domain-containing protein [Candidatus Brocadiae bacterium]|nr:DUF547 domain-containing protein [Candidatus Brocadiia bacterium]